MNKNADILEKFRKEAEEYRSKWLRKNHSGAIRHSGEEDVVKLPNLSKKDNNRVPHEKLPYSGSAILDQYKEVEEEDVRPIEVNHKVDKITLTDFRIANDQAYQ